LQELLLQYNPHWEKGAVYDGLIPRDAYVKKISGFLDRREIVVLKGIRRSGKSSILKLLINELLKIAVPPQNILFMNLEDFRFGSEKSVHTLDRVYQTYLSEQKPDGKMYVFLDEIQEIPEFEKWLRTHYEQNPNLKFIITGSSSSLFSTELATLLTGRQISLEIFPFSFPEYLTFKDEKLARQVEGKSLDALYLSSLFPKIEPLLRRYLDEGGFPEVIKHEDRETNILLLQQYLSDIILKDITRRYNIRKIDVLQKLSLFLIYNMGNIINITRAAGVVGSNRTTVLDLIAYLKEVYLVLTTPHFSFSPTDQLEVTRPKKTFCIDNGFYSAIKTESKKDFSKRVKNVIFQRLRFQWQREVYYWKEKVEIEFMLSDGLPIGMAISDEDKDREMHKLFYIMNRHNLPRALLITWDKLQILEENERRVFLIPLWIFLTTSQEEIFEFLKEH